MVPVSCRLPYPTLPPPPPSPQTTTTALAATVAARRSNDFPHVWPPISNDGWVHLDQAQRRARPRLKALHFRRQCVWFGRLYAGFCRCARYVLDVEGPRISSVVPVSISISISTSRDGVRVCLARGVRLLLHFIVRFLCYFIPIFIFPFAPSPAFLPGSRLPPI